MRTADNHAGVRFPPPLIFLGLLLAGLAADALLGLHPAMPGAVRIAGGFVLAAGIAMIAHALRRFRHAGTSPEPWRPDQALVSDGLYRRSRNPMYLGMALTHGGLALSLGSLGALLSLPIAVALIDRFVIVREERHLIRRFGTAYEDYCRHVRRWI